jgi:hypothetical protein
MDKKDLDFFSFLGERCIQYIFKDYLYTLEDLLEDKRISEEDFDRIRERILDKGNDSIRFFKSQGESYFKNRK